MEFLLQGILMNTPILSNRTTGINLEFINPLGNIAVGPLNEQNKILKFEIINKSNIGMGDPYNLDYDGAIMLFSIALSLLSENVLFRPLDMTYLIPGGAVRVEVTQFVKIDEKELWELIKKLLDYEIFNDQGRSLTEINVLKAIESYQEAMFSLGYVYAYKSLYAALETSINAVETRPLRGHLLDQETSNITGFNMTEIKEIRTFNNSSKHKIRNPREYLDYLNTKSNLEIYKKLKAMVDEAIKNRIS